MAATGTSATGSSSLHFHGFYDPVTGAAVEGDTWTFDHGAADPFEGCRIPLTFEPPLPWRRIDALSWADHSNPPTPPLIAGTASLWLGYFVDEACTHYYVEGLGYGNNWYLELRSPPLTVPAGTDISVDFDCFYDMEPGYDSVFVAIEQGGTRSVLGALNGQAGSPAVPVHLSYPTTIQTADAFKVLFIFVSDGSISDEDGQYDTALGPFGLDDVDVQGPGLAGPIPPPYDFESGIQGFTVSPAPDTSVVGLNDILAYGPAPTCAALSGNVVEFHDDLMRHPFGRVDVLASNAVPLPATSERLNVFVECDVDAEQMMPSIGWNVLWSYFPDTCSIDGADHWSPVGGHPYNYVFPQCGRSRMFATDSTWDDLIPAGSDSVRFYLRVGSYFSQPYADTPYPLFDNLRVGISHRATVLHVPSPSYPNIQTAVTAAPSGDTVMVAPGVYQGAGNRDIDFGGKQIVLIGEGGSDATTVDCENSGRGIVFENGEGPGAVVCGLRFVHGEPSGTDGGAIRVENASPTFVDCVAESSTTTGRGGGVYVNGNPLFLDCRIGFNDTPVEGGGIYVDGGDPQFVDCTVSYNTSGLEGGGIAVAGGGATFTRCQLSSNSSSASGGGLAVLGGTPAADTCGIDGNSANVDGGGMLVSGGAPSFTLCAALSNTAIARRR